MMDQDSAQRQDLRRALRGLGTKHENRRESRVREAQLLQRSGPVRKAFRQHSSLQPVLAPMHYQRGPQRGVQGTGEPGRKAVHAGLWQNHQRACRSYREEASLSLPSRFARLLHSHAWVQLPFPVVSELGDLPDAEGGAFHNGTGFSARENRRSGRFIAENHVRGGHCRSCGAPVAGVGMDGPSEDVAVKGGG
jgi:hypothetical protein